MKLKPTLILRGLCLVVCVAGPFVALSGCVSQAANEAAVDPTVATLEASEKFIDAFYSWDAAALAATFVSAGAAERVLYYQAWAQAGGYQIQDRQPCTLAEDERYVCAITVTDDIGGALGYVATDTFRLQVENEGVVAAEFTGDDPPILQEVLAWIGATRPQVLTGPCKDFFNGGTTPAACVRAVVQGAKDYVQQNQVQLNN